MSPHTKEERNEKFKKQYPNYQQVNSFRCHITGIDNINHSYFVRMEDEETNEQYEMELSQDKIEKKLSMGNVFWLHVGQSNQNIEDYIHYIEVSTLVWTKEDIKKIMKNATELSKTFQ